MTPRLLPLSCVAGSLALSFTGAAHAAPVATPTATPAPATQTPTASPVVPPAPAAAATPAGPPALPPESAPAAEPVAAPPTTTTAPPMGPSAQDIQNEVDDSGVKAPPKATTTGRPGLLRPTERRYFFTMFVGGSKAFLGGYSFPYGGGGMDFKIEGALGGHSENRPSLAGAAVIQVTNGFPFSSFTIAPRIQWDKQLLPDYAIYMTTTLTAGYRMSTYGGYGLILGALEGGARHGGMIAVGWGASTIVAERLLLSFRPVNVELTGPGSLLPVQINYDVLGGIGVVW